MSEGVIIAIIGLISSMIVALISAYATVEAAKIGSQSRTQLKQSRDSKKRVVFGLVTFGIATIILIVSVSSIASQVSSLSRPSYESVNLGSTDNPPVIQEASNEVGKEVIYSHYPAAAIRYTYVDVDDRLVRVEKVCGVWGVTNITGKFTGHPGILGTTYESKVIDTNGCRIDFIVVNTECCFMGIEIKAEYVR